MRLLVLALVDGLVLVLVLVLVLGVEVVVVVMGAGEPGHQRQSVRDSLRQAGAEAALQSRKVRMVGMERRCCRSRSGRWRRRRLEEHGAVGHEHGRVARVEEVTRAAGLRSSADQGVDAKGAALHHQERGGGGGGGAHREEEKRSLGRRKRRLQLREEQIPQQEHSRGVSASV